MSTAPWDYMDGSTYSPPPPPPPPIVGWNQSDAPAATPNSGPQVTPTENGNLTPPGVPKQNGGSGSTVVDTASMDTFASNMGKLIAPVNDALSKLKALEPLAPGAFADAYNVQTKVSGASSSTTGDGLVPNYTTVLQDLVNGLTDIQSAAQQMSSKYKTADDLNNMSVTDLQNNLNQAQGDFSNMMSANGGMGATTTTTTGGTGNGGSGGS